MTHKTLCIKRNTYKDNRPVNETWCGKPIAKGQRVFSTIDMAFLNRAFLSRNVVCDDCWKTLERLIEMDRVRARLLNDASD